MTEELRQILLLLVAVASASLGSLINYGYHKYTRRKIVTWKGTWKSIFIGFAVGFITWLTSGGGEGLAHMTFIGICFAAGISAESIIGKTIGAINGE